MLNGAKGLLKRILNRKTNEQIELEYRLSRGMKIGKNCHLYSVATIDAAWPWLISFGDNVTVSTNVTILAHDASPNVGGYGTKLGRVRIGNNVFVGSGTTILCNVSIGDNVIIGAGSVVTRNLPSDAVYAGVPAKRVCSLAEYKEKYAKIREERPYFGTIRPWNQWNEATDEEKQLMLDGLEDGIGFI